MLQYLTTVARGPAQRFEVMAQLVSSLFDLNPSMATHLKPSLWRKCVVCLLDMLKLLQDNPNIKVRLGRGGSPSTCTCTPPVRCALHGDAGPLPARPCRVRLRRTKRALLPPLKRSGFGAPGSGRGMAL